MFIHQFNEQLDCHSVIRMIFLSDDQNPLGSYNFQLNDVLQLQGVYIQDDFKGKGYGKSILMNALEFFQLGEEFKKYDYLYIKVLRGSWMVEWYKRNGFEWYEDCLSEGKFKYDWYILKK